MPLLRFPDWQKTAWRSTVKLPATQKLMLILAGAEPQGMTHADIAAMLELDRDVLDQLLSSLVRSGEISMTRTRDGQRLYRRLM